LSGLPAPLNDLFGVAPQEYLPHGLGIVERLGVRKVPRRVEGLCECKMLFRDDSSRDALLRVSGSLQKRIRDVTPI
jgi:hypothetical protein